MGFLTNVATGALAQINQNYDNDDAEQNQMLKQRATVVDKVAAAQNSMDRQAAQVYQNQKRVMGTYGITDPDQAYYVAQLNIKDPDKEADIVKRMKPTGGTVPGCAGGSQGNVTAGYQHQGNILTGPSYNIPPVQGPSMRPQPARRAFSVGAPLIDNTPKYSNFPEAQDPTQAGAQARVAAKMKNGEAPDDNDMAIAMHKPGATTNETATRNGEAFAFAFNEVAAGHVPANQFSSVYQSRGGDGQPKFDPSTIDPKAKLDPAAEQKVKSEMFILQNQFPDVDKTSPSLRATAQILALSTYEAHANDGSTYRTDSQGRTVTPQLISDLVHSSQRVTQPQPNNSPTPGIQPQLFADNPTKIKDKPYYQFTQNLMSDTPKILGGLHNAEEEITKDPTAIGIPGFVTKHFGGILVNIANQVNPDIANKIDSSLKVGDRAGLETDLTSLETALMRPMQSRYTQGRLSLGNGGQEIVQEFQQMFAHEDYNQTPQALMASLQKIENNYYRDFASAFISTHDIPGDLAKNDAALEALHTKLIQDHQLSNQDAIQVAGKILQVQAGGGLK